MAAQKTFGSRDLRRQILSYGGKTCKDLTDDYKGCVPPFRYRNAQTGQLKLCYKECYENMALWLEPLLANLPTSYVIKVKSSENGKARKVTGEIKYGKKLAITDRMNPQYIDVRWVDVQPYYYSAIQYAKSAKYAERDATFLMIEIHDRIGSSSQQTLSFPGSPLWDRFAPYIRHGRLALNFGSLIGRQQEKD